MIYKLIKHRNHATVLTSQPDSVDITFKFDGEQSTESVHLEVSEKEFKKLNKKISTNNIIFNHITKEITLEKITKSPEILI